MYDYSSAYLGSLFTYGGGALLAILLGMGLLYVGIVFFAGLMAYYFTGAKPGAHILHSFMRVGARFYAHGAMFVGILFGWVGLGMVLRALFGALVPSFVYASSTAAGSEFQTGLVLSMFAVILFAAHWAMAHVIETPAEKKGTFVSKIFTVLGLTISGIAFFVNLLILLLEVLAFVQTKYSQTLVHPGASLAALIATVPVWGYFAFRGWNMIKHEEGSGKKSK